MPLVEQHGAGADKIRTRGELIAQRRLLCGQQVVFTNGCFDLLHAGHRAMLQRARALGDCLMVGVNSDVSVRALKGPGRPVHDEATRLRELAELEWVSYVCLFDEVSVERLVVELAPDILAKGGDYTAEHVVGRQAVESAGGRVVVLPFWPGYSTTDLIARGLDRSPEGERL